MKKVAPDTYVESCNVNFLKSNYLEIRLNIIRRATYWHVPVRGFGALSGLGACVGSAG